MSSEKIMSSSDIGAAIRRRRLELALSQEELAARLDVSYQQIQRYESGRNRLNVENIQLVAGVLSVSVGYFFQRLPPHIKAPQTPVSCPQEQELVEQFRKIQDSHLKEMLVNLSRLAAKGEEKDN